MATPEELLARARSWRGDVLYHLAAIDLLVSEAYEFGYGIGKTDGVSEGMRAEREAQARQRRSRKPRGGTDA